MFAAYVFTIIDSQDMQERHRLGPVAVTPGGAQCKGRGLKIAHRFSLPFICWPPRPPGTPRRHGRGHIRRHRQSLLVAWRRGRKTDLHSACRNRLRAGLLRRDGMMRGDEQVKLPPLPRDGFAPSGHALPDLRPHRRAPARQSQRSPDRALPAGTPGSARPPFRIAGPRRPAHRARLAGWLPSGRSSSVSGWGTRSSLTCARGSGTRGGRGRRRVRRGSRAQISAT
jgi:hypothetical protein